MYFVFRVFAGDEIRDSCGGRNCNNMKPFLAMLLRWVDLRKVYDLIDSGCVVVMLMSFWFGR